MKNQRGAVVIIVALCIVGLLGMAALAIDLGYMYVTRNELQNISDSASLAATRYIGHVYEGLPYQEQGTHDFASEVDNIKAVAKEMGLANIAATKTITLNDYDIQIGRWDFSSGRPGTFTEITGPLVRPSAVRVVARRDSSSAEGRVGTFFAKIFGSNFVNVNTLSVASLSSQSTVEPGNIIPIGISDAWYKNKETFCNQPIRFYPANSPEGCAGWNVFSGDQISADGDSCQGSQQFNEACLRKRILETWVNNPAYQTPGASTGDIFQFGGGNLGNQTFDAFRNVFDKFKIADATSPSGYSWTAEVVVYNKEDCSNPTGPLEILGFSTVKIIGVWEPSETIPYPSNCEQNQWCIQAIVLCDRFETSRGGGGEYGTFGTIPNLVQ